MVVRTIDKEPLTSLLGRYVDKDLFDILSINNMDPFGEYGEYHSIVLSAPYMKCEIDVLKGSVEKMTTYFNNKIISHMIYRIEEYKITDKHEKMLSKSF
jgi:diphthamide synthase (EF-2-diphthine--ammonia ligase)